MNEAMKEINDEIKKVKEETNSDFEIEVTETTDEPLVVDILVDDIEEQDFKKIKEMFHKWPFFKKNKKKLLFYGALKILFNSSSLTDFLRVFLCV